MGAATLELCCLERGVGSSLAISSHAFLATAQQSGHHGRHTAHCRSAGLAFSERLTQCCSGLPRKQLLGVSAVGAGPAADSEAY